MRLWDRSLDALSGLVDRFTARIDYFALYSAVIVSQSSDLLSLDVQPDSTRLPGMQGVPLKTGVPGVKAQVVTGAHVLVGWENGDPRRPFASLWSSESVSKLVITASAIVLNSSDPTGATDVPMAKMVTGTATPCTTIKVGAGS